ncbi:hypothetical protein AO066_00845 [Pseudomonas fluorescens]|nr:hypothetical protein AO066_00845 [Pseudomonas fluorescens]
MVASIGDTDNSLSMRWVKLGSTSFMNHVDGAVGGQTCCSHVEATAWGLASRRTDSRTSAAARRSRNETITVGIGQFSSVLLIGDGELLLCGQALVMFGLPSAGFCQSYMHAVQGRVGRFCRGLSKLFLRLRVSTI